jgi:heme exporter protein B
MWTILWKDLTVELRTGAGLATVFVLGLLVLLLFQFALPAEPTPEAAAAALWIAFVFAGTLGAQRTFLVERENLCLWGLVTAPLDPAAIYIAKTLGTVAALAVLQLFMVPLTALFFNLTPTTHLFTFVLVCVLGNFGFAAVSTLFAAIAVGTTRREMVLPLLVLPLLVPVVIAAVKASSPLLAGRALGSAAVWLQILAGFDLVFAVAGLLLFEYVVRE